MPDGVNGVFCEHAIHQSTFGTSDFDDPGRVARNDCVRRPHPVTTLPGQSWHFAIVMPQSNVAPEPMEGPA